MGLVLVWTLFAFQDFLHRCLLSFAPFIQAEQQSLEMQLYQKILVTPKSHKMLSKMQWRKGDAEQQ